MACTVCPIEASRVRQLGAPIPIYGTQHWTSDHSLAKVFSRICPTLISFTMQAQKNSATHKLVMSLILFYGRQIAIVYNTLQPRTRPRQPSNLAEFWLSRFQLAKISDLMFWSLRKRCSNPNSDPFCQVVARNSAWSRASARKWNECIAHR